MRKPYLKKVMTFGVLLFSSTMLFAQDLNLTAPAEKIMTQLEKAFPFVAAAIFIGVGIKNLGNFTGEGDMQKGIKNVLVFVFALLIIVAVYKFVKGQALG